MGYKDPTYVVFDGDEDKWAYAYMLGWVKNDKVAFDFRDAHDLDTMTGAAQSEAYVKGKLRERMKQSSAVLVLVGKKTKNLYKYVRWELELAQELGLPIIVANLNGKRSEDEELCPAIIRGNAVVHVAFKMAIIQHALNNWPTYFYNLPLEKKNGPAYHYNDQVYKDQGIAAA